MSKRDFLRELRAYLTGKVGSLELEEALRYYETYLDGEIASGKSEAEATAGLGDPRIIGKSIADAAGRKNRHHSRSFASEMSQKKHEKKMESGGWSRLKLYGAIGIVILLVLAVLIVLTRVIAFFFPLIVVVLVIALVFRKNGGPR